MNFLLKKMKIKIMGETYNYIPFKDEMYVDKLKIKLMNDKSFIRVFKNNVTDKFIKSMKTVIDPNKIHEMNTIWSVYGGTGTGKSIVVMSLAKILVGDKFSYKNMCFFDSQVLEKAKDIPRDSFIVRDEGVGKAVYGVGSQRTSRQLHVLAETCRKYGLNLVFIEPEFTENELAKYYIETFDMDIDNRITRCALREPSSKQCIGAIYVKVLPEDDEDWVKYNEMKDKFIENMKSGKLKDAKEDYKSLAKKILQRIDLDVFTKKKERLAYIRTQLPTMTNAEIEIVATFLEVMIKKGEDVLDDEDE